ncbi:MAG: PDZ domain-containing protein, partial [Planctomycetota bacterium]|nr:PDZ domain-containing protein [Planctomycetota bacterium]
GALIEYLGHADPDVRVVAERRLLALGAAAHPALREAFDHRDAEVRRRLQRLLAPPQPPAAPDYEAENYERVMLMRKCLTSFRSALSAGERTLPQTHMPGWGMLVRQPRFSEAHHLESRQDETLVVTEVAARGLAARLGIEAGDLLVAANGAPFANPMRLARLKQILRREDVILTLVRGARRLSIDVAAVLTDRRHLKPASALARPTHFLGLAQASVVAGIGIEVRAQGSFTSLHFRIPAGTGCVVEWVEPGSWGQRIGLQPCDLLLTVDGEPLHDTKRIEGLALEAQLKEVRLGVLREGLPLTIEARASLAQSAGVTAAIKRHFHRIHWLHRSYDTVKQLGWPTGLSHGAEGLILRVKESKRFKGRLVLVSIGTNDGVSIDDELHMSRGNEYVGTVRITKVVRDAAVGRTTDVKGSAFPPKLKDRVYAR